MKNIFTSITLMAMGLIWIQCNKDIPVTETEAALGHTTGASNFSSSVPVYSLPASPPHSIFLTPQKPANLIENKYARINGLTLRLKRPDQVYLTLMSSNATDLNDLAYQYLKPNGTWSSFQAFRIKMTHHKEDTLFTHYLLAGDSSIPAGHIREIRLAFIKPNMSISYSLPFVVVTLEYYDQGEYNLLNGNRDHGNLNCEQLSKDIAGHRAMAEEYEAIKTLCNQRGLPTIIGIGGAPAEARLPSDEGEARELCADIDNMIKTNEKDLEDALDQFKKLGCRFNATLNGSYTSK